MPIRRASDPTNTQCIWDAIIFLTKQNVLTEPQKVLKQLIKMNGYSLSEWENCIKETLSDKLIEVALRNDVKYYKLPDAQYAILDGRDWYCFECHNGGDVIFCKNKVCHRVYHLDCIAKTAVEKFLLFRNLFTNSDSTVYLKNGSLNKRKSLCLSVDGIELIDSSNGRNVPKYTYDKSLCIICNMMCLKDYPLETSELNYLFRFVLDRIRSWIPLNITHRMKGSTPYPEWQSENDLVWRANHLFFECMDMGIIEENIYSEKYFNCHNLLKDILLIKHNIGIFHGIDSQEYAATEYILRDTLHDLGEIIGCVDCYKHSNEKINDNWFAIPCRVPHEIVWAKQKGYCYWPAKVIKESGNQYDVRFFGGKHERSILNKQFIKPISYTRESLRVKKTAAIVKAIEEMELHQRLSKNPEALKDFQASSKKKVSIPRKARKSTSLLPPNISYIGDDEDEVPVPMKEVPMPSLPFDIESDTPSKNKRKSSSSSRKDLEEENPEIIKEKPSKMKKRKNSTKETLVAAEPSENVTEPPKKKKGRPRKEKKDPPKKTKKTTKSTSGPKAVSDESIRECEVIDISDGEDNEFLFSRNPTSSAMHFSENYEQQEQVTSSTECRLQENTFQGEEMRRLDHPYCEEVEMMGRKLGMISNKKEMTKFAMNFMQAEIDRITEKHNDHLRKLFDSHNAQISETKKKQWCYYCEQDAIYHCCWNTAYCSTTCQQQHWHAEHKKVCRRKR